AAGLWGLLHLNGCCRPSVREGRFVVRGLGLPGSSLSESTAAGKQATGKLGGKPAVCSGAQQAGRAELGEDTWGVEYSELEVDLQRLAAEDAEQTERQLKGTLREFPGFSFEVLPFLSERIKETLSGTPAAVAVKVYGDDLAAVDEAS